MRKTIFATMAIVFAATSFGQNVGAATIIFKTQPVRPAVVIQVRPVRPVVVQRIVVRQPCYTRVVKTYKRNKEVITKTRVCP